jgi:flavorubredoxin
MKKAIAIADDVYWVGVNDRETDLVVHHLEPDHSGSLLYLARVSGNTNRSASCR